MVLNYNYWRICSILELKVSLLASFVSVDVESCSSSKMWFNDILQLSLYA